MRFVVVDPRLLVRGLDDADGREAKLLALLMYGWVCANARGLGLDEADEAAQLGEITDPTRLAAVRSEAKRIQFDAHLRKALIEDRLGAHAPDDLALVSSQPLRAELVSSAQQTRLDPNVAIRFIAHCTVKLVSLPQTRNRAYLLAMARSAEAVLITDDDDVRDAAAQADISAESLDGFMDALSSPAFRADAIDAPAIQRAFVRPLAPIVQELLPGQQVFANLVREAAGSAEILAGAVDAGVAIETLDAEISELAAVAGVRHELSDLIALNDRLVSLRATASSSAIVLTALEAERKTAIQRLRAALREQILRQLRAAIEREAGDSYSTLLKVGKAPGLAQTLDGYGVDTRASCQLGDLVHRMPSGSVGIAGRRGVGKSHLIERFCTPAGPGEPGVRLGTVVSAPTQYDSREFLLHLFGQLCETILGGPDARAKLMVEQEAAPMGPFSRSRDQWGELLAATLALGGAILVVATLVEAVADPCLIAGSACLVIALALVVRSDQPIFRMSRPAAVVAGLGFVLTASSFANLWAGPAPDAGAIALGTGVALWAVIALGKPSSRVVVGPKSGSNPFSDELILSATARLDEIQYQKTLATGWASKASGKLAIGGAEVGAEAGLSGSRTLERTALTFPELVARLRAFLTQATTPPLRGAALEVRIGIDELDKMESDAAARRFLNEIKGVFGIPRCFFLISVSEEALSNFDRRGAQMRDVFDSAFDEIIYVEPLCFTETRALLAQRVIRLPIPYQGLCHVLSGGLPRDLIRSARTVVAAKPTDADGRLPDVTAALIGLERDQRVRALAVAARNVSFEPYASGFLQWTTVVQAADVSAPGLLSLCEGAGLRQRADDSLPWDSPERAAEQTINQLSMELMTFCYLAATVMEFFDDEITKERLGGSQAAPQRWAPLEALSSARAASATNPSVGWGLVSAFRGALSMTTFALPQPADAGVSGPGT